MSATLLNRAVRAALEQLFKVPSDFEAFAQDDFPNVKRRFSQGMERTAQTNLLLDLEGAESVLVALKKRFPTEVASIEEQFGIVLPSTPLVNAAKNAGGASAAAGASSGSPSASALREARRPSTGYQSALLAGLIALGGFLLAKVLLGPRLPETWPLSGELSGLPDDHVAQVRIGTCQAASVLPRTGQFSIALNHACAPAPYELVVMVQDCEEQRVALTTLHDYLRARLQPCVPLVRRLTGHVYRSVGGRRGAPLQDARVELFGCLEAAAVKPAMSDKSGAFELAPIPTSCLQPRYHLRYFYKGMTGDLEPPSQSPHSIDILVKWDDPPRVLPVSAAAVPRPTSSPAVPQSGTALCARNICTLSGISAAAARNEHFCLRSADGGPRIAGVVVGAECTTNEAVTEPPTCTRNDPTHDMELVGPVTWTHCSSRKGK